MNFDIRSSQNYQLFENIVYQCMKFSRLIYSSSISIQNDMLWSCVYIMREVRVCHISVIVVQRHITQSHPTNWWGCIQRMPYWILVSCQCCLHFQVRTTHTYIVFCTVYEKLFFSMHKTRISHTVGHLMFRQFRHLLFQKENFIIAIQFS